MQAVTTIGLDIAKSVFQIHGVDAAGNVIVRRQLKRRYVLPFFQSYRRALSASKPVLHRIIGHGNSKRSGTPCA
jgi:transposase